MTKKRLLLYYPLLIILLTGCGGPWITVGGKYRTSRYGYEVDLPQGWRRHKLQDLDWIRRNPLVITRDGMTLQQISIVYTKKRIWHGMSPNEVVALIVEDIRSNPNMTNPQFTEKTFVPVGSYPGFKLLYTYQTRRGLKIKVAYYGVLVKRRYYYLRYEAPARYYFAKDYRVFEGVKNTFYISKGGNPTN